MGPNLIDEFGAPREIKQSSRAGAVNMYLIEIARDQITLFRREEGRRQDESVLLKLAAHAIAVQLKMQEFMRLTNGAGTIVAARGKIAKTPTVSTAPSLTAAQRLSVSSCAICLSCSTPDGIKGSFTKRPPSSFKPLARAQRLTASKDLSPLGLTELAVRLLGCSTPDGIKGSFTRYVAAASTAS